MDQVRIKDWYSGSAHHVELFHVAEGYALLNNNVQNLVSHRKLNLSFDNNAVPASIMPLSSST